MKGKKFAFFHGTLLRGTLILTLAGFLTRIIGFFYRVFLAGHMGETLLGIYQLLFTVYGITFTIYGAGIQTAVSGMIAAKTDKTETGRKEQLHILKYAFLLSMGLAVSLSLIVYLFAEPISVYFLLESSCASYLKILCLLFPFCSISSMINGFFYGKKKAKVPAISQIMEQLFRVAFVCFLCIMLEATGSFSCKIAVYGVVIGEIAACIYNILRLKSVLDIPIFSGSSKKAAAFKIRTKKRSSIKNSKNSSDSGKILRSLIFFAGTLTGTKLVLAILRSAEAVFIPAALQQYGYSNEHALAIFGIFSGIALPFILFPATITSSLAVMLLPAIAEAHAERDEKKIRRYIRNSTKYCTLIGFIFTLLFLFGGDMIGTVLFHNQMAGEFIKWLSFLCPFLYLSSTFTSIINGLGKTQLTFLVTAVCLGLKILSLITMVPLYGMQAYLIATLVSQIIMTLWEGYYLKTYFKLPGTVSPE